MAGNVTTETQVYRTTGMAIVDGNLVVVGTDADDDVTILGAGNQFAVSIISPTAAGLDVTVGTYVPTATGAEFTVSRGGGRLSVSWLPAVSIDHFVIHGLAGNDSITVLSPTNAEGHGGAGNDMLLGGAGDDVLWGGDGNDLRPACRARQDVLVGGFGSDRLVGSAGHDLLISGELAGTHNSGAYDYATLRAIDDVWAQLWTPDSDLSHPLDDVVDESLSEDVLTGSSGRDWFILGSTDWITDFNSATSGDRVVRVQEVPGAGGQNSW